MKCNFEERARSLAERETGCPLDHCPKGHHIFPDGDKPDCTPECFEHDEEYDAEIANAERAAGWDPNP